MSSGDGCETLGAKTFGIQSSQTLQGFNIHVDEVKSNVQVRKAESGKQLNSLAALRPALATINNPILVEDSSPFCYGW